MKEWLYIQSSLKNDIVLLGMILGIELGPVLEVREEDGALIPSLKMKIVVADTPEKIDEQKKIYLERKKELLAQIGDTHPDVQLSDSLVEKTEFKDDEERKEYFWQLYLKLEEQYEATIEPIVVGDHRGVVPSYKIVPKPKLSTEEKKTDVV